MYYSSMVSIRATTILTLIGLATSHPKYILNVRRMTSASPNFRHNVTRANVLSYQAARSSVQVFHVLVSENRAGPFST
jgi:hypothetical protein